MLDLTAIKTTLKGRCDFLSIKADEIERVLRALAVPNFAKQAKEADKVMQCLERAALSEISDINAALTRLDNGSYGACVSCGKTIHEKRLEAVPHTGQCIPCATE